jgi:AraC-like DNA-binding protein
MHAPQIIAEHGGHFPDLAEAAGLGRDPLADLGAPLEGNKVARFHQIVAEAIDCPSFSLQLGSRQDFSIFGDVSCAMTSGEHVRDLLRAVYLVLPLYTGSVIFNLVSDGSDLVATLEIAANIHVPHRQIVEQGFALLATEVRRHVGGWCSPRITLRHSRPANRAHLAWYGRTIGPNVEFNADRNAFHFDEVALAARRVTGDAVAYDFFMDYYDKVRSASTALIETRVEQLIRLTLPYYPIDLTQAAGLLHMSARTLQRRLEDSGRPFKAIVQSVRADLAQSYLQESSLSLTEIAGILQFPDSSAFSHAVRRWHGKSPRALRKEGAAPLPA